MFVPFPAIRMQVMEDNPYKTPRIPAEQQPKSAVPLLLGIWGVIGVVCLISLLANWVMDLLVP
jgi:hypothetical protein